MRDFFLEWFVYLLAACPFGFAFLCAVVHAFGRAWGEFPFLPGEGRAFRRYTLPRAHLLCFRYFDSHKPRSSQGRKLKP